MIKIKILILFMVCVFFSGCEEYGEKRIVKLITVDGDNISLYYYDYSQDKPTYLKEEKKNNGIKNTLVELLSENEYDLKLCKYAVCDTEVVMEETDIVYKTLIDAKFSPDICILEGDTKTDGEKYIEQKNKNYPVYSYKVSDAGITGVVEKADENIKNIIINSRNYKTLGREESFVFDLLGNNVKNGTYVFEHKENIMSAVLERISTFCYEDNNILNITLSAELKSYKGMAAGKDNKEDFIGILQNNLHNKAEEILQDKYIKDSFSLLWYKKAENFDAIKINIEIHQ